jgi:RNA polymerase sigma factor (TIGR02999 family)
MADVAKVLALAETGDSKAASELLPWVYDELRRLAAARMAEEKSGQTLQATALVHEVYLRLVGANEPRLWTSRVHFVAAAAEAMRQILVDAARRRSALKRNSGRVPVALQDVDVAENKGPEEVLSVNEALERLAAADPQAAEFVKLRYFVGLTVPEAAAALGLPTRTAERLWAYARTWLRRDMRP